MPKKPVRDRFNPKSYYKVKKKKQLEEDSLIFRAPSYHPRLEHSYGKKASHHLSDDVSDEVRVVESCGDTASKGHDKTSYSHPTREASATDEPKDLFQETLSSTENLARDGNTVEVRVVESCGDTASQEHDKTSYSHPTREASATDEPKDLFQETLSSTENLAIDGNTVEVLLLESCGDTASQEHDKTSYSHPTREASATDEPKDLFQETLSSTENLAIDGNTVEVLLLESCGDTASQECDKTSYSHPTREASATDEPKDLFQETLSTTEVSSFTAIQKAPQELVMASLEKSLPPKWHAVKVKEGINISFGPDNLIEAGLSQRFISVTWEGSVVIHVHGKKLPPDHPAYSSAHIGSIAHDTVDVFVKQILDFISAFRQMEICCGIYLAKYKVWWKKSLDTCFIDNNSFCEARYSETLRRKDCEYLVDQQRKRQCANCLKTSAMFARRKLSACSPTSAKRTPNKFKPYKTLTSAEKDKREKKKSKKIRALQRQVSRLRAQVDSLIQEEGVEVDSKLDKQLGATLQRKLDELKKAEAQEDNHDKFLQIFIEQQLAARNAKGNHGINWHPIMIRFALQMKLCSQSSLNSARNFIRLPSDRLLWDYTHMYSEEPGVNYDFINEIASQVKDLPREYQSYHVLTYDEIVVSQNLVQKKSTGKIIGYQKLNEVQTELLLLKEKLEADATNTPAPENPTLKAAKKILTFMVRGTASGIQSCVASYPVVSLVKEDLHQYVWEVTGALETSGLKVVAFISDGSTVNRSFYEMQPPFTPTDGLTFDTPNPWDLERPIFFIPDPPHALKTARNGLENSGRKKCRHLKKNGQELTWKPIIRLFKWKSEQTIKKLPKLTAACVYLNSYSRMSVPYAARVMSNSVPSQIRLLGWPQTEELCIFKYL